MNENTSDIRMAQEAANENGVPVYLVKNGPDAVMVTNPTEGHKILEKFYPVEAVA